MKNVYSLKSMLLTACLAQGLFVAAQSPTVVSNANNCTITQNFNTTGGNFSSPSIYSDPNDVSFSWYSGPGALLEGSGLTARTASVISPVYSNTGLGNTTVGFNYIAPPGSEYRIRVISGVPNSTLQILATTANGPVWTPFPSTSGNICLLLTDADLTFGAPLRFEITYRATAANNMLFDNFALATEAGPLPVSFMGFVARKNDNGSVKLLWDVASEINVKGYEVEASLNGSDFTSIGFVNAAAKNSYNFTYNQASTETRFFRIKNVDFDGKYKYSPIIKVNGKDKASEIQLYPVPAKDQVYVQHEKAPEKATIAIISPDGRIIRKVNAISNTVQTSLDIHDLKPGLYIVKYDDGAGDSQTTKLIKN